MEIILAQRLDNVNKNLALRLEFMIEILGMDKVLTTTEAAERLGVTPGRVRQMVADGQLPVQRIGRDNLIKESDLALVADRKRGRPPKQPSKKSNHK